MTQLQLLLSHSTEEKTPWREFGGPNPGHALASSWARKLKAKDLDQQVKKHTEEEKESSFKRKAECCYQMKGWLGKQDN